MTCHECHEEIYLGGQGCACVRASKNAEFHAKLDAMKERVVDPEMMARLRKKLAELRRPPSMQEDFVEWLYPGVLHQQEGLAR